MLIFEEKKTKKKQRFDNADELSHLALVVVINPIQRIVKAFGNFSERQREGDTRNGQ